MQLDHSINQFYSLDSIFKHCDKFDIPQTNSRSKRKILHILFRADGVGGIVLVRYRKDRVSVSTMPPGYVKYGNATSFFSFAKQKLKSVQGSFQTPTEPSKPHAQYFSSDSNNRQQFIGIDKLLLHARLLTTKNEYIPPNKNTKERRKYEQGIISWTEDSVASRCASCSKAFGISKRKHHCRLDGRVICSQCSRLLPFSVAQDLIDPTVSPFSSTANTVMLQRLVNLTSLIPSAMIEDASNEDNLRICIHCEYILQKYHNQIRYKHIPVDQVFFLYEKILHAEKQYKPIQSKYTTIIESLLNGNTQYQLVDAQRVYRELSIHYDKIDSVSKSISKLAEGDSTAPVSNRYAALCRNIRTYSTQMMQNFSISTRRLPTEDDLRRIREEKKRSEDERMMQCAAKILGMKENFIEMPPELEPFVQQYYRVTQFLEEARLTGHPDEVQSLEMNLKELEQAIRMVELN
ncbi:unnamed protein product [Adineta ricciae]|uniref:FYVE-type domain-containing protein n=1 Tax=Adineta ricciae TaxID=249248 RepID=A0A815LXM4_ADIRI|nr:unnamed protein product [Adineta ricciae]